MYCGWVLFMLMWVLSIFALSIYSAEVAEGMKNWAGLKSWEYPSTPSPFLNSNNSFNSIDMTSYHNCSISGPSFKLILNCALDFFNHFEIKVVEDGLIPIAIGRRYRSLVSCINWTTGGALHLNCFVYIFSPADGT